MRLKQYLQELFLTGHNVGNNYVEIFVNPSKKELIDIVNTSSNKIHVFDPSGRIVRFTANIKNKKVYAWRSDMLHSTIMRKLKISNTPDTDISLISGVAKQKGNKFVMVYSDTIEYIVRTKLKVNPIEKWKFADKYIQITPFLKKKSKEYKQNPEIF